MTVAPPAGSAHGDVDRAPAAGSSTTPQHWRTLRAQVLRESTRGSTPPNRSEYAAALLARVAEDCEPGARLGTKTELREFCEVSVGTFNEAIKLAQSRGYIHSRPGPGGGVFAAEQSPIVRLGNSVLALDGSAASVADAVRMRDALDPLLIQDALRHSSAADIEEMRECLGRMSAAIEHDDPVAFIHGNWALHARIAQLSPSTILRSVYLSLLHIIEEHTLAVRASETEPLPDFIAHRHELHVSLVDAIEARDHDRALALIREHNTTASA